MRSGREYYRRIKKEARDYLRRYDLASLKKTSDPTKKEKVMKFLNPFKAQRFLAILKPVEPRIRPKRQSKKKRLALRRGES